MSQVLHPAAPAAVTPPPGGTQLAESEFRLVALDRISPSPYQLRKEFDEEALKELAASIKEKGVLEPVLLRPKHSDLAKNDSEQVWVDRLGLDDARFELVAGERRFRAAKLAGLKEVPAIVRRLSDREAAEIGVIENLQRRDLSPLEEAEGFQLLISRHGYTADTLAEKIGKSKSRVYGVLKLNLLPEKARKALAEDKLSTSVAQLIGRIPSEKLRREAADTILGNAYYNNHQRAKELIEQRYMKELKGAPFDQADGQLLPTAGSCAACPKRTGNNRADYPEGRADICTEPSCFEKKVAAFYDRQLDEYRQKGHTIVSRDDARKMFQYSDSYNSGNSAYVMLSATSYEDPKQRTYGQILGKGYKAHIAQTPRGTVVKLATKSEVNKALREMLGAGGEKKGGDALPERPPSAAPNKPDPARELMEKSLVAAGGRLAEAAAAGDGKLPADLLRELVTNELDMCDEIEGIVGRRGIACAEGGEEQALEKLLPSMTYGELLGLFVEMHFHSYYSGAKLDERQKKILDAYGVDFEAVKRDEKKRLDEWKKRLAKATTADEIAVEVDASRLKPGGDIEKAYNADKISNGKVTNPFEYEGELFVNVGGVSGEYRKAVRLVARAYYKRATKTYGQAKSGASFYEGMLVKYLGEEHVLTGPTLKCVPKKSAPAAGKKAASGK